MVLRRRTHVSIGDDDPLLAVLDLRPRMSTRLTAAGSCSLHAQLRTLPAGGLDVACGQHRAGSLCGDSSGSPCPSRHPVHPGARRVARRHGVPLAATAPRHLKDVVQSKDLVVAVCDQVHEELTDFPRLHWSVPDPVRNAEAADFERAFVEINHRVEQQPPRRNGVRRPTPTGHGHRSPSPDGNPPVGSDYRRDDRQIRVSCCASAHGP